MTTWLNVKNNAESALASAITAVATSLTLITGDGAKFPASNFHISIDDEILKCSSRTNDVLTVVRAQESTTATTHAAGAIVSLNVTAEVITQIQGAIDLGGAGGDMLQSTYDADSDGIVDKAESVDDGTNSSTAADIKDAVDKKHAQQHSITSTSDHTSTATAGKMLKADANGLPVNASNTDTDVADAVTKKHTQGTDTALGAVGTKNPPIDDDKVIYRDSTSTDALVTSTWTQVKTFLKTYWDTLYAALTHASRHAVGGADSVFPADPNADRYLMWDDDPGQLAWVEGSGQGVTTFLGLTDTPDSYANQGGKVVRIKATADGLEFVDASGGGDMYKSTYDTDNDGKVDKAESVDDGTYSATAQNIKDAVDKKHSSGSDTTLGTQTADLNMGGKAITNVGNVDGVDVSGLAVGSIIFIIDGGGSAITTGQKGHIEVPFACTISQVTLLADQDGAIKIDIWKDTYANFPPADADTITGGHEPEIAATGKKSQDSTLTDWTKSISAGDILAFNVDSCTTITRVMIAIKVSR